MSRVEAAAKEAYFAAVAAGLIRINSWGLVPAEENVWREIARRALQAADALSMEEPERLSRDGRALAASMRNVLDRALVLELADALDAAVWRITELEMALRPFANIARSAFYDASENETYAVVLREFATSLVSDITGQDIERAQVALGRATGGNAYD